jgi:hypothetical protein
VRFEAPQGLLSGVKAGMAAYEEELFGPVAAITTFVDGGRRDSGTGGYVRNTDEPGSVHGLAVAHVS